MKFVNGYDSLKSLDALEAAVASYHEGYTYNSLNSNWYLNLDNGQAFNGRVQIERMLFNDGTSEWSRNIVVGLQVAGEAMNVTVFTTDGTGEGLCYILDPSAPGGRTITPLTGLKGKDVVQSNAIAQMTPQIAAQGGFTLGA